MSERNRVLGPVGPHERPDPGEGEVSVPWVGRDFFRHRIVVVAINFNRYSPLGAQWWIRRGDIHDRLGQGSRRLFPYRVGQYLAAIVASQSGRRVIVDPDPSSGAQGLEACAFIQAVQCSPARRVSQPGDTMWANCPQRYLVGQMQILKPRVVLAVGQVNVWPRVPSCSTSALMKSELGFAADADSSMTIPSMCCSPTTLRTGTGATPYQSWSRP